VVGDLEVVVLINFVCCKEYNKLIIAGDNVKKSRYDNRTIEMSIYDFLLDSNSLEY